MPDPMTGALAIDPEIRLKAQGFDLEVSLFYSTIAVTLNSGTVTSPWGNGRSASISGKVNKVGSIATITRGDFSQQYFEEVGTAGGITTFVSSLNTGNVTSLSYDVTAGEFTEYFLDGMQIVYKDAGGSGQDYQISRVVDPSGNTHTYTYGVKDC